MTRRQHLGLICISELFIFIFRLGLELSHGSRIIHTIFEVLESREKCSLALTGSTVFSEIVPDAPFVSLVLEHLDTHRSRYRQDRLIQIMIDVFS